MFVFLTRTLMVVGVAPQHPRRWRTIRALLPGWALRPPATTGLLALTGTNLCRSRGGLLAAPLEDRRVLDRRSLRVEDDDFDEVFCLGIELAGFSSPAAVTAAAAPSESESESAERKAPSAFSLSSEDSTPKVVVEVCTKCPKGFAPRPRRGILYFALVVPSHTFTSPTTR